MIRSQETPSSTVRQPNLTGNKIAFFSASNLDRVPYYELAARALALNGCSVTLFLRCPTPTLLQTTLPYPCQTRTCQTQGKLRKTLWMSANMLGSRLSHYDTIFIGDPSIAPIASTALFGQTRKPLVYQTLDYYDPIQFPTRSRAEGRLIRKSALHINGEFHRAYICQAQYRAEGATLVLPPNLPTNWPIPPRSIARREKLTEGRNATLIMHHGGFSRLRATKELLRALTLLPQRFRLVMTCGNSSDLESAIKQVGAEGRVKILPNLDHFDLLNYTVNADIGVLLYANNDLGNYFQAPGRLTEYLACGLPILASDYAGLSSLVNKFGIGDCADPTSPQEIAAAILRIEAIRARGAMQPQQIRQTFLKHFAFERFAPSLLKAFDDLRYSGTDRKCGPPERVY